MAESQPISAHAAPQRPHNLKWTNEAVIAEIQRIAEGKNFLTVSQLSYYLKRRVVELFGGFPDACLAAGVAPGKTPKRLQNGKICAVQGCHRRARSSRCEYCETHYYRLRRNGILGKTTGNPASVNHTAFEQLTDSTAWVLGLLWTDGCIAGNQVILTSKDLAMLEDVEGVLEGTSLIKQRRNPKYWDVRFHSSVMVESLKRRGITEAKSLSIRWPIGLPDSLVGAFIRGLIDGDGSVRYKPHFAKGNGEFLPRVQVTLYSGSEGLAADVRDRLASLGIETSLSWTQSVNCRVGRVTVCNAKSLRLLYESMHGSNGPALARKKEPFSTWFSASREWKAVGLKGGRGSGAKLSQSQVDAIRQRFFEQPRILMRTLGEQYGVHFRTIQAIVRNRTWTIPEPQPLRLAAAARAEGRAG